MHPQDASGRHDKEQRGDQEQDGCHGGPLCSVGGTRRNRSDAIVHATGPAICVVCQPPGMTYGTRGSRPTRTTRPGPVDRGGPSEISCPLARILRRLSLARREYDILRRISMGETVPTPPTPWD